MPVVPWCLVPHRHALYAWQLMPGCPPRHVCVAERRLLLTYYLLVPGAWYSRSAVVWPFLSGCPVRMEHGGRCGRCHTPWQRSGLRRSPLAWRVAVGWRLEAGSSCARHPPWAPAHPRVESRRRTWSAARRLGIRPTALDTHFRVRFASTLTLTSQPARHSPLAL